MAMIAALHNCHVEPGVIDEIQIECGSTAYEMSRHVELEPFQTPTHVIQPRVHSHKNTMPSANAAQCASLTCDRRHAAPVLFILAAGENVIFNSGYTWVRHECFRLTE